MKFKFSEIMPPLCITLIKKLKCDWQGNYSLWEDAQNNSTGYDSTVILEKVRTSCLKVKNGDAVYERDSVLFDTIDYSWPLLTGLLLAAAKSDGKLHVLDFGGSLGSTYYQNKKYLDLIPNLSWSIVEQSKFVEIGKTDFEDERLKFFYDIASCVEYRDVSTILFSSVLQYIEKPFELLEGVFEKRFKYILIDRTTFIHGSQSRIAVQKVPKKITGASYPIWLFNENQFCEFMKAHQFKLIESFYEYKDYGGNVYSKGFIYESEI